MKKLTVVALALTAAFQAQAVEVYKNDSTLLDLYGRIYAGQFFGEKKELDANGDIKNEYSDKQGANQFVRLGAKVESEINPGLKALAQYELQIYVNDSEKTVSENSDNMRTRLAFAGVGADWGNVTFGRQKGAPACWPTGPTSPSPTATATTPSAPRPTPLPPTVPALC